MSKTLNVKSFVVGDTYHAELTFRIVGGGLGKVVIEMPVQKRTEGLPKGEDNDTSKLPLYACCGIAGLLSPTELIPLPAKASLVALSHIADLVQSANKGDNGAKDELNRIESGEDNNLKGILRLIRE